MLAMASETAKYVYPEGEDPAGSLEWWLWPRGETVKLVPDEVRQVFDTLGTVPGGLSSFKKPRNIQQGAARRATMATRTIAIEAHQAATASRRRDATFRSPSRRSGSGRQRIRCAYNPAMPPARR